MQFQKYRADPITVKKKLSSGKKNGKAVKY